MADRPTVFVVDDDPGALRSLCWLIQQADLPVRAFRSGREFLESYCSHEAGCLVLDVRMPELDGLEVQQRLWERGVQLPIIFITAHGDVPTCAKAFRAGAFDFLEKPVDDGLLLDYIHKALARCAEQKWPCPPAEFASRLVQLTVREKEVLDLLLAGKTLKEIAASKGVTVQTIWKQRGNILQKMGVDNDVELVRAATQWAHERRL
jgi:two-component system, LuxR family, response regulator FixJ